jgi:hypothetical protein
MEATISMMKIYDEIGRVFKLLTCKCMNKVDVKWNIFLVFFFFWNNKDMGMKRVNNFFWIDLNILGDFGVHWRRLNLF